MAEPMMHGRSWQFELLDQADAHYQNKRWDQALEAYSALVRENPYHGKFQYRLGEPTGSSPNFVGEENPFTLPYSGLTISASNLAWQGTFASDRRVWIAPEIAAELTSADFKSNRDPAMNAILHSLADRGKGG